MRTIHSAITWTAIVLLIVLWLPLMSIVWLFDRDPMKHTTGRMLRRLGGLITKANPAWRIVRTGELPADMRHPYVVVCNHQSNADPPVVSTLPCEMKWVAKDSLFRLPVAGWMMRMARDIPVDRKNKRSRANVLNEARTRLEQKCSVMFMPEGTRSRDGRVKRFQDGAFRLAIELGIPVLPLCLDGTASTLPKSGWRFGEADVRLHVFEPLPTAHLSTKDAPSLRAEVRTRVLEKMAEWRGVDPSEVDGTSSQGEKQAKSDAQAMDNAVTG